MKSLLPIIVLAALFFNACSTNQAIRKETAADRESKLKARDHFTAGVFFEQEKKHENALIEFYQALLYDSASYQIYNRIAENHMALGRYESALRYLQKSIRLSPSDVETYRLTADCYYRLKDDDRAAEYLSKVLEMDPYDDNSRSLLLLLYRKNNDQMGLAGQYEQMLRFYGGHEEWVRDAGTIYLKKGELDRAIGLYTSYLKEDSTNARIWFSLGYTYELKNKNNRAVSAYQKALQFQPAVEAAAQRVYQICRELRDWDKLIAVFTPFYKDQDQVPLYRIALAEAYLNQEEFDSSKDILLPLLQSEEVPWQTYELLGRIEMRNENLHQAGEYFQKIIDLDSSNRIGWLFKGFVLADADSLDEAEAHYRLALKYIPDDPFLLSFHGISLNRLGRDIEALQLFEKAISIDPDNLNALVSYGITLNRLNRKEDAIRPFSSALRDDSTNFTALSSLGMIYDELKYYDACDSLYEVALQRYPDNDLLLNNYAYSLSERGEKLEFALEMSQKAVASQPENGAYLDTIGWIHYKLGDYELALKYIKLSIEKRDNSPVVIEHLGDVYKMLGQIDQAKQLWKQALELDSDNEPLRMKIESH